MHPDAEIRLPAESAYVAVLRMASAGIAARLDFTLEALEDLRMAIGEGCALALEQAGPGTDLVAEYFLSHGRIEVAITVQAVSPSIPDTAGFGWLVLSTTATAADAETGPDRLTIRIMMQSPPTRTSG